MSKAVTGEFCGCMAGPNDPDPKCSECGGTGKPSHEWQLVPKKADVGMLAAWYRYKNGHHFHDEPAPRDTSDVGAWAAMLAAAPAPPAQPVAIKPLNWQHDGNASYAYCPVTDVRWAARNQAERAHAEATREARIRSALSVPLPEIEGGDKGDGWQLIDTAPKDGTWVLLYWPTMAITAYPACGFSHADEYGWELAQDRDYGEIIPTHWRPLPAAPSASIEGETP